MAKKEPAQPATPAATFEKQAEARDVSLAGELLDFLRHTRKWWLAPILLLLFLVGLLVALGGSVAAPFIYALF
jgi:hypothetical protein